MTSIDSTPAKTDDEGELVTNGQITDTKLTLQGAKDITAAKSHCDCMRKRENRAGWADVGDGRNWSWSARRGGMNEEITRLGKYGVSSGVALYS